MKVLTCITCKKPFETDNETIENFGREIECIKCIDNAHIRFMQKQRKRGMMLSCVKGCFCGFGK